MDCIAGEVRERKTWAGTGLRRSEEMAVRGAGDQARAHEGREETGRARSIARRHGHGGVLERAESLLRVTVGNASFSFNTMS